MKLKIQRPNGETEIFDSTEVPIALLFTENERTRMAEITAGGQNTFMQVPLGLMTASGLGYWRQWGSEGWGNLAEGKNELRILRPNLIIGGPNGNH